MSGSAGWGGAVPDPSDTMLAELLRALEAKGAATRTVAPSRPVRVEHHRPAEGRAPEAAVHAVTASAEAWVPAGRAPPR